MKKTRSLLLLIFTAVLCHAETRTLTAKDGKQIEAEIKGVEGEKVTIETKGKVYTLPFTRFSEEDITHFKEWAAANPAPAVVFRESDLTLSFKNNVERIKQEKEEKTGGKKDQKGKQTQQSESYTIVVNNTVSKEIPEMQVKYTIYKLVREKTTGKDRSGSEDLETTEGASETSTMAKLAKFEFTTDAVTSTDSESSDKKSGSKTSTKEDVWGVIATVYSGDTEILTKAFPDNLTEKVEAHEKE